MGKTPKYKTAPIKKRGKDFYRLWGTVGTKRLADWEIKRFKRSGTRYFIEKSAEGYRIWYRPGTQEMAKRDLQRYKAGR